MKLNWHRSRLHSKPSLDHRYEEPGSEFAPDRAGRWLRAVEKRRQRESRRHVTVSVASSSQ
jgi:hypothetical protein